MYKKLLSKITVLAVPVLLLLSIVNFRVDGAFVFDKRSDEIARILVSGKNAAVKNVPAHWADLQVAVVNDRIAVGDLKPRDILVWGTSRSSEINAGLFSENSFFNCVVPGGNILDYVGLYGLYKKNGMLPGYVFISIDPWTFHARKSVLINNEKQSVADSVQSLNANSDLVEGYNYIMGISGDSIIPNINIENNSDLTEKVRELFSLSYFQVNAKAIFSRVLYSTTNDYEPSFFVVRRDGGYSLSRKCDVDSMKVERKSRKFIDIHNNNFFLQSDTSNIYFGSFKDMLVSLQKDGVKPIIYFSPVNPVVYDGLAKESVVAMEYAVNNFCNNQNIKVIGSFNPHKYGYNSLGNNFIDAYHPVKSVVNDIFFQHSSDLKEIGLNISDLRNSE
jgi:hypothetical protein